MKRTIAVAILVSLAACGGHTVSADPLTSPKVPPKGLEKAQLAYTADLTTDKVELGKTLFFDPRLSSTGVMSCSTCHHADKAWTDGLQFSPKHDGKPNTRNTPTVYNTGYLAKLYWDGRAQGLEKNVLAAWTGQMGGDPKKVAADLLANADYKARFQTAFGKEPSEETIVQGLAAFLAALRTGDSAFDRYMAGQKDALTDEQRKGYELFIDNNRGGCALCHHLPLFTDAGFHNTGIGMAAATPDVGAGGPKALNDAAFTGAFKTPTLRGVEKTAPYFHDGSVATLEEAVRFMAGGGRDNEHKDRLLQDRKLGDAEIKQLVAFLKSLTSNEPFTPPSIPK